MTFNLTLDVTLNTNFAQVEADDQQINLTRFSLFFPEKRLFFQERSSNFDFNFETSQENNPLSLDPARIRFNWSRRTIKGFAYGLSYSRAGANYNPGMGFEMRENYSRLATGLFYGWIPSEKSPLFSHQVSLSSHLFLRNADGEIESATIWTGWQFRTKSGWEGEISPRFFYENVPETFSLSDDAEVQEGRYSFYGLRRGYC